MQFIIWYGQIKEKKLHRLFSDYQDSIIYSVKVILKQKYNFKIFQQKIFCFFGVSFLGLR